MPPEGLGRAGGEIGLHPGSPPHQACSPPSRPLFLHTGCRTSHPQVLRRRLGREHAGLSLKQPSVLLYSSGAWEGPQRDACGPIPRKGLLFRGRFPSKTLMPPGLGKSPSEPTQDWRKEAKTKATESHHYLNSPGFTQNLSTSAGDPGPCQLIPGFLGWAASS